jgi:hypothetical protein
VIEASAARDGAVLADRGVRVIDYGIAVVEIHIVDSGEAPGEGWESRACRRWRRCSAPRPSRQPGPRIRGIRAEDLKRA